jgi:hypothetical protein
MEEARQHSIVTFATKAVAPSNKDFSGEPVAEWHAAGRSREYLSIYQKNHTKGNFN